MWSKAKTGRNDLCCCGSGKKYKHCHYEIDSVKPDKKYAAAQSVYSRNWNITSEEHLKNGDYGWLARKIAKFTPKRVLDIGCGTGQASLALVSEFGSELKYVGLDENRNCLQKAKERLKNELKIESELIARATVSYTGDAYEVELAPIEVDVEQSVLLIESDICNDLHLPLFLKRYGPFDAVTVWFTGTHMMRHKNAILQSNGITNEVLHRLFVQNTAYELADDVLGFFRWQIG